MEHFVMRAGIRDGYAALEGLEGGLDEGVDITDGSPALGRFREDA